MVWNTGGSTLYGRYRLERPLGSGGEGSLWEAFDLVLNRAVAVAMAAGVEVGPGGGGRGVTREARVISGLMHPRLARVYDLLEVDEGTFIVMELVKGESLAARLAREGRLPADEAACIAAQCADALDAAHQAGLVHRDVKPASIMLTETGVKVVDFGIAGRTGPTGRAAGGARSGADDAIAGPVDTATRSAPERDHSAAEDGPAADLYALGVVLYRMLAGRQPFDVEGPVGCDVRHAALAADPPPLPDDVPGFLADVCDRLLARDPAARPASAGVAVEMLTAAATDAAAARTTRSGDTAAGATSTGATPTGDTPTGDTPTLAVPLAADAARPTARPIGHAVAHAGGPLAPATRRRRPRPGRRTVIAVPAFALAAVAAGSVWLASGMGGRPNADTPPTTRPASTAPSPTAPHQDRGHGHGRAGSALAAAQAPSKAAHTPHGHAPSSPGHRATAPKAHPSNGPSDSRSSGPSSGASGTPSATPSATPTPTPTATATPTPSGGTTGTPTAPPASSVPG